MKYLVTGATGFIGREVCRQAAAHGAELVLFGRCGGSLPEGAVRGVDLAVQALPPDCLEGVDAVLHLAGIAHRRAAAEDYRRVNAEATLHLARQAADAGVRRFVFLSSVKAMGPQRTAGPRVEHDCAPPVDAYGASKWQAECALRDGFAGGSMAVVILRPALVYGPGAKANLALLSTAVRRGLPRPPALGARSMIALQDLARLCCELGESAPPGVHTWIVCDGEAYSARRLYDALREGLGRGGAAAWSPPWLWRLAAGVLDLGRGRGENTWDRLFGTELYSSATLREALGWRPQFRFEDLAAEIACPEAAR